MTWFSWAIQIALAAFDVYCLVWLYFSRSSRGTSRPRLSPDDEHRLATTIGHQADFLRLVQHQAGLTEGLRLRLVVLEHQRKQDRADLLALRRRLAGIDAATPTPSARGILLRDDQPALAPPEIATASEPRRRARRR